MAKLIATTMQSGGSQSSMPITQAVKAGTAASIQPGMLVIKDASNAGYWKAAADAATTTELVEGGIATSASTETASVDGTVTFEVAPIVRVKMFAKTPANLTASMKGSKFILDVTGGNYTLDQATTTNGILTLLDFDNITNGLCDVLINLNW